MWYGSEMINHYLGGDGPALAQPTVTTPDAPQPVITVASVPMAAKTSMSLCRSLVRAP
jgi:hypothetical protein